MLSLFMLPIICFHKEHIQPNVIGTKNSVASSDRGLNVY